MTALEQQLIKELEQEKALSTELISKLDEQESSFLRQLQQMQTAYEINLSKIVQNYESNLSKNMKELKSMQTQHEATVKNILTEIKQILNQDITFGETGESYHEQLQTLKKQVWGLQEGQKELRTSLHNIITKMFPSQI